MPEQVSIADKMLAYEVTGQGPSSFSRTGSVTAGTLTVSSPRRWPRPVTGSRTSTSAVVVTPASAGDLVAVVRHLGGPAVIIGQSISGGAATIAAATAPEVITGVIELAPFTREQPTDLGGLVRVKRFRTGYLQSAQVVTRGSMSSWKKYLDVAYPVKSADWSGELARVEAKLSEPGR
jgi:pimeloyl-ACP methyl ester carboxylesterase